jgi:hypothetical protein
VSFEGFPPERREERKESAKTSRRFWVSAQKRTDPGFNADFLLSNPPFVGVRPKVGLPAHVGGTLVPIALMNI